MTNIKSMKSLTFRYQQEQIEQMKKEETLNNSSRRVKVQNLIDDKSTRFLFQFFFFFLAPRTLT